MVHGRDQYRFSRLARARTFLAEGCGAAEETGLHGMAAVLGLRDVRVALDAGEPEPVRADLDAWLADHAPREGPPPPVRDGPEPAGRVEGRGPGRAQVRRR